jgi:hypothetical protein
MGTMTDNDMEDLFAYARRTDPRTSHVAAASMAETLSEVLRIVFRAVRSQQNGATVDEVVDLTGIEKVTVSPRFKPLCEKGLLEIRSNPEGDTIKRPGKSGRNQIVWFAKQRRQP